MFGLGAPEIIIILVIALVIFGPKKLPELGKSLGQGIREFRKGTSGLKEELESSFGDEPAAPAPARPATVERTIIAPTEPAQAVKEGENSHQA